MEIRSSIRIKCKKKNKNKEEFMPADSSNHDIITIEDDQEINETLDLLLSEDAEIQFSSLNSLAKLSNFFPENVLQSLTQDHLTTLYNFLENAEFRDLVIFTFSNLSRKSIFTPPTQIFKTILDILLDVHSDETEIFYSLILAKNLIISNESYFFEAISCNIHQAIIKNDKDSSKIIKTKISALSAFLIYQCHDIEEDIFSYLMQDAFIQSNKAGIYREIIKGFEYALEWSIKAIQIVNESNLIAISSDLLLSDISKNVKSALSFLKKCLINLEIADVQFIKFFVLVLAKDDEEENILEDIILSLIVFVTQRISSRDFLFNSLCEIGISTLFSMKSFPVKKSFLSFLDRSAKICPKEVMIISPNDLGFFLQELILTGDDDLQGICIDIICILISIISDSGDSSSKWAEDFASTLIEFNVLDNIYQSSIISNSEYNDQIDLLSSFLSSY